MNGAKAVHNEKKTSAFNAPDITLIGREWTWSMKETNKLPAAFSTRVVRDSVRCDRVIE